MRRRLAGPHPVLVTASLLATVGIYELLVRRFRISRLLFGMKWPAR